MLGAFAKTGVLPFTRAAHLKKNRADIQIGDALIAAEEMEEKTRKREEAVADVRRVARRLDMNDEGTSSSHVQPIRLAEINRISEVFGEREAEAPANLAKPFALNMWPRYDTTRRQPAIWSLCLDRSPNLKSRFTLVGRRELLKFHNVGLLMEDEMANVTPAQALILGHVNTLAYDHRLTHIQLACTLFTRSPHIAGTCRARAATISP